MGRKNTLVFPRKWNFINSHGISTHLTLKPKMVLDVFGLFGLTTDAAARPGYMFSSIKIQISFSISLLLNQFLEFHSLLLFWSLHP